MAGLTDQEASALKQMVVMSGWKLTQQMIAARARLALTALVLEGSERTGEFAGVTDATLRARVQEAEWLLGKIQNELAVYDYNKRNELEQLAAANGDAVGAQTPANL